MKDMANKNTMPEEAQEDSKAAKKSCKIGQTGREGKAARGKTQG